MRFARLCFIFCLCAVPAVAAEPGQRFERADVVSTTRAPAAQQAIRPGTQAPKTLPGLYARPLANNLGTLSALATDADGTLYALDEKTGRLYGLADRGQDGRLDGRRIISSGFDRPSGLAVDIPSDTAFVADARAVWRVSLATGQTSMLASLGNTQAQVTPRPLVKADGLLILGLSEGSSSQILGLNTETGRAQLLKSIPSAPLSALAAQTGEQIWAAAGGALWPVLTGETHFPLEPGTTVTGLLFPNRGDISPAWPSEHIGQIYIAQAATGDGRNTPHSGGYNVVRLASQFGLPEDAMSVVMDGFFSPRSRQSWGAPGPMVMTKSGLVVADRYGTIWAIAKDDRPARKAKPRIGTPIPDAPVQKPSRKPNDTPATPGSLIGSASAIGSATTITQGSTLAVGSYLKKQVEEEKAAAKAAKDAEREAKKAARKNGALNTPDQTDREGP